MNITCTNCGKSFTFDRTDTARSQRFQEGQGAAAIIVYYPACPYCKTRHTVTVAVKE